jgi:hypothetical protein
MTTALIFGHGETQFAHIPEGRNLTVRVTAINTDGARITTASAALDSVEVMRDELFLHSTHDTARSLIARGVTILVARREWRREREAAQTRIADALVEFHRPANPDASRNVRAWLALLEAVTQTPVETIARAKYAFEVRIESVLEVVVEKGKIRLGEHSVTAPAITKLDDALSVAAEALGTDIRSLCVKYAIRGIVHRTGVNGEIVECADSGDLLRGKRRLALELHEHLVCATCHRAIRTTTESTAAPPPIFFPRLVVCNLCPLGQEFALWNGMRMEYDIQGSSLRVSSRPGPFAAQQTRGEPNAVRAAREVMIALLLAIERVNGEKPGMPPLVAFVRGIPTPLLRMGFETLLGSL